MQKQRWTSLIDNRVIIAIFSVAIALVLALGITFAWLTDIFQDKGNSTIGEVGIELYNGDTKINGTIKDDGTYNVGATVKVALGALNETKALDVRVKNTGTIPGIVRCFVVISSDEGPVDHYTDLAGAKFIIKTNQMNMTQTNWVNLYDHELINDLYAFNSFLNEQLNAGTTKKIIDNITPTVSGLDNTDVFVHIRAEIVAYSGNAYQVNADDKDKPFGVLTSDFLEQWTAWKKV